jgi:hypothetical protein
MTQIYREWTPRPDATPDERMTALYRGIISIGEDLYCKGSHLSELNKQLNAIEAQIAEMRRELEILRTLLPAPPQEEK